MSHSGSPGVVVGVDETLGSGAALVFAMSEAALRGSTVEVVTAWTLGTTDCEGRAEAGASERVRRLAQQIQDAAVARALGEIAARPVLSRQVLEGQTGDVLSRVAEGAAYLVVGASTEGFVRHGSVSEYCMQHATCPLVVVPL
jgi:nucleotide-binding universal stress UspA family protein